MKEEGTGQGWGPGAGSVQNLWPLDFWPDCSLLFFFQERPGWEVPGMPHGAEEAWAVLLCCGLEGGNPTQKGSPQAWSLVGGDRPFQKSRWCGLTGVSSVTWDQHVLGSPGLQGARGAPSCHLGEGLTPPHPVSPT